jgi:hypothetical protein
MDLVNKESDLTYKEDYYLLKPWCAEFERLNPGSVAQVLLDDDNRFVSITIISAAMVDRAVSGMRLAEIDCAFTKHRLYKGQLMAIVGRDGNGKIIPVAIKLCPAENVEQYRQFFQSLKEFPLPNDDSGATLGSVINSPSYVHISDRCKGLMTAAEEEFPLAHHMNCFRHLLANMKTSKIVDMRSIADQKLLWQLQCCTSRAEFEKVS